ncbi:O-antigen ligase family protein [Sporosarcina jeotgali]|uniref:O-antigen ligase family protein n=1 Tax=Sporosarcina jeotgali TaxID=3020056 RepID=A0ABZ0KX63_9BACL|nr:O-antigen ligase family protein [Sporosarcina sp. B2O-1]WOV84512.1 O-antigen ligase family protein [Sporosarcina sp. B2O-1]
MDFLKSVTQKERHTGLFLILFTFMLSNYNVYIGFYLKPYMILLVIFLLFHLSSFSFQKMYSFEIMLLLFYLFYVLTGAFSAYPFASIRMMAGIALLIGFYFILKFVLRTYSDFAIQEAIAKSGLLFNGASLLMYIAGIKKMGLQAAEEMSVSYGVLFDRDYPRLVGLLLDPNLFVFYNSIFFAYFLTNMTSLRNKIGFALCTLTTVLTFSRGGILAMFLIILIYIVISNSSKRWKTLSAMGMIFIPAAYFAVFIMKINVGALLGGRIEDFSSDGGSGRFELWGRAWEYFLAHPVIGIGADNFIEYNNIQYGENLYTHNTLLQILTESGLLGFTLYVLFLLLVFVQLLKRRLMKEHMYLLLIFIAFLLQIMSLSLIIHEVFILYLAILSVTLQRVEKVYGENDHKTSNVQLTL